MHVGAETVGRPRLTVMPRALGTTMCAVLVMMRGAAQVAAECAMRAMPMFAVPSLHVPVVLYAGQRMSVSSWTRLLALAALLHISHKSAGASTEKLLVAKIGLYSMVWLIALDAVILGALRMANITTA